MRKWVFGGLALLLVVVAIPFIWARVRLKPMLRERLTTAIREHYRREIEVKDIEISAVTGRSETTSRGLKLLSQPSKLHRADALLSVPYSQLTTACERRRVSL